ncbi:MAG: LuxR C-terminal-related transcriptional regulator [Candidatus Bathyarchaeota archaeon]|jgi:DNA-binding CsgD family transcriptional regulator|nr:LuxR C-terminal-related transcriptional regulator [Candidatus Bathyarchaeota archaeon]
MDRKKNRSDRYQSLFAELPYSNEMMAEFPEAQGLVENYKPEDRERLMDLRDDLREELWRLVDNELTARQRQVIRLYAQGYTQIEIAKQLNVNQSSITKSINGNCDYRNGKKIYGGARKKLRRLADKDPEIQTIIAQIAEIHSEYR